MRIIAVVNQKGGVGKTTTSVNLGAGLALRGRRVLLIDMDPQGNLTDHLLPPTEPAPDASSAESGRPTIYDVLVEGSPLAAAVVPTATPGLFVLPSHEDLAGAELDLAAVIGRELLLRDALADLPPDAYDYVFLDCPPSLGLLSLNALAAADEVFIALQTEFFAMRGLAALNRTIDLVRRRINPRLNLGGIVPTLVDPTRLSREIFDEVRAHYGERVFTARIRTNVRLAEAPSHGRHIFDYAPDSAGAADYAALAAEVEEGPRAAAPTDPAATVAAAATEAAATPLPAEAGSPVPARAPAPRRSSIAAAIAEAAAAVGGTLPPAAPAAAVPPPAALPQAVNPPAVPPQQGSPEPGTRGPAPAEAGARAPEATGTEPPPAPTSRRALPTLPFARPGRAFPLSRMPIRAQPSSGARTAP